MPMIPHMLIAICIGYPMAHAHAGANKCTDGNKITYANIPCEELGLKNSGAIKNRVTIMPYLSAKEEPLPEADSPDNVQHPEDAKTDITNEQSGGKKPTIKTNSN